MCVMYVVGYYIRIDFIHYPYIYPTFIFHGNYYYTQKLFKYVYNSVFRILSFRLSLQHQGTAPTAGTDCIINSSYSLW